MGDFSSSFGMGFEIGSIIKEKRKAKKILEQVQNTIQEWKLSGEEPSYVDKVLMSVLLNQAGSSYAASFADIENNKNTMDREKLSQDGMNLRTLNDNGMALLKMIETSAKEGTLGLIDWFQVPKEMFPPDFDLNKFLSKDTITKLQNDDTRQAALDEVMGITRALPEEYRKGYMEQQGVLEEGLQPTPKEPTALSAKDNWAIENYKTGKISFDQLSKYMGAYIEPEKATELQKKIAEAKQYGATNEEIKKMIVGGTAGGGIEKPRVTSLPQLEEYRDKALNADSWEDAEKIINDYTEAGYDATQLGVTKETWANNQKQYINNLLTVIKNITDEKGNLKKKKLTQEEVGLEFKGEQSASEIYKIIYASYIEYLEKLKNMGIDVNEFPTLKTIKEMNKGFWQKFLERGKYTTP